MQTPDVAAVTGGLEEAKLEAAKAHLDEHGYCVVEGAISSAAAAALRERLTEQAEAEAQLGAASVLPDKKQLIYFLLNKGQGFRDLLFHPTMRQLVGHVIGPRYLLSSYNGHLALPGGTTRFHTDQWWMPPPTTAARRTLLRPGEIARDDHRGHYRLGAAGRAPAAIAPACVCNVMWTVDDFTAENGATIVVPGSHLFGREPDHELDADAGWKPAAAPAGSFIVLDGRVWHSTGENRTDRARIGLTTNFCAWQFRQQENLAMGVSPEVLANASTELLDLIGFQPTFGYGGIEARERIARGQYALGEMKPS